MGPIYSIAGRNFLELAVAILGNGRMWNGKHTFPIWVTLQALTGTNKALASTSKALTSTGEALPSISKALTSINKALANH